MSDVVLGIRLTIDGQNVSGEIRGQAEQLRQLGQAAAQSNTQAKTAADQFVASLRKQAETLGMTRSQTLAYEASQHNLTRAQREQVAQNIQAIEQHERHQQVLGRVRLAAIGAGAAIGAALVSSLRGAVRAGMEAEQAQLRLEAVLRATGNTANLTSAELTRMAESMQGRLGFDDETVKRSMAVMLTFRQVTREHFGEAMEVAANLSRVLGTDLQSSVLQLGKALEDPEQRLTALTRSGVSFTAVQKEMIRDLVDTGRQGEAITLILQTMKDQGLDRVAEAMHQGLGRATTDLKNNWNDFLERLGQTDAVKTVVGGALDFISTRLKALADDSQRAARAFVELTDELFRAENDLLAARARGDARAAAGAQRRIDRARARLPAAQRAVSPPEDAGNLIDLGADVTARAQLANVQDRAVDFLRQFRTDADRRADDLRRLEALHAAGGMTPDQLEAGRAAINAKYTRRSPGQDPYPEMLKALEREIELKRDATALDKLRFDLEHMTAEQRRRITPEREAMLKQKAQEIDLQRGAQVAEQQRLALAESYGKQIEEQIAARQQLDDLERNAILSMRRQAQQLEFQVSLIGLTNVERERAVALAELEQQKVWLTAEAYEALRKRINAAYDDKGVREARQKHLEDERRGYERMQDDIRRGLTDSLFRGFEAGKSFGKVFFDSMKHMAATTVLRPVVEFAMAPYSRAIAQILGSLGIPGLAAPAPAAAAPAAPMAVPINANIAHRGGVPAYDALPSRAVPASLFRDAPRMHAGIGPGERPAIIRDDEAVLTPGQMRMLTPASESRAIRVELVNRGSPKTATEVQPRIDVHGTVVRIVLDDARANGPITQTIGNTFGLRRR
jgi:hypothetical protein